MRLFVAVTPSPEALAHAGSAVTAVRARHPDLRWIPVERWHLTLAFYGEVPDAKVDSMAARLGRTIADRPAMTVSLRGSGVFSRRALWLGVCGEVDPLRRLAQAVSWDDRPYRPHLTVARLRGDVDAGPAVAELADYAGPPWAAGTVRLVRSRLGPQPAYDDVASWTLESRS